MSAMLNKGEAAKRIPEDSERSAQTKMVIEMPYEMAEFFLSGLEPKVDLPLGNYRYIAQTFQGRGPYFVTLFSSNDHIPVYSAYTLNHLQAAKLSTHTRGELGNDGRWRETPGLCCNFGWIPCTIYKNW